MELAVANSLYFIQGVGYRNKERLNQGHSYTVPKSTIFQNWFKEHKDIFKGEIKKNKKMSCMTYHSWKEMYCHDSVWDDV